MERDVTGDSDNDDATIKALSAKERDAMPASNFAFIDAKGGKHLPIHDEGHTRAAMGRLNQTDFSGAKGDPGKAKAAAARKIKAAAKRHGIDVSDDSNVSEAASKEAPVFVNDPRNGPVSIAEVREALGYPAVEKGQEPSGFTLDEAREIVKGVVQDALNGTATPEETAHDPSTGLSGLAGPVTAGAVQLPEPRQGQGMHTYSIPAEAEQDLTKNAPQVSFAVASLAEAIERIGELRDLQDRAEKAGMTLTPPTLDESVVPGDPTWESYDATTLKQIATILASVEKALDLMIGREQTEAMTADPGDAQHAWDLQAAQDAMKCAAGIVARLSFSEAAEATKTAVNAEGRVISDTEGEIVVKVGRKISGKTESVLRAARDHLTSVIGDGEDNKPSGDSADSDEGSKIEMELTKNEFTESVIAIAQEVLKNANNGGDISEGELHADGTIGDDLTLPGSGTDAPGITKETQDDDVAKQLKALSEQMAAQAELSKATGELVTKMAKQPRAGGPILDGRLPSGVTAATEGRDGDSVQKSATDMEVERLEKQLETERDPNQVQFLTSQITLKRLADARRTGVYPQTQPPALQP